MEDFIKILSESIKEQEFITCIFSNPRQKLNNYSKMSCKKIEIKNVEYIQFAMLRDNKEFHANVPIDELVKFIYEHCTHFKQIQLYTTTSDFHILVSKNLETHIKNHPPTKSKVISSSHNRIKNYILANEKSIQFLKALGIMDDKGNVKPTKSDKYKQINRYLEFIQDIIPTIIEKDIIRIVDFGCGKSYLTFAMYHYFKEILDKKVEIIGLDLKEDVIQFCNTLARELDFEDLHFQIGDIGKFTTNKEIDIVVSLHACNTATDAAIAKAVNWNAKVIMAVPCCHHEAYEQIDHPVLKNILKYGILKERIASLLTDGLRANLLESYGYKVNVIEFIDMEHTPKNILIRAVKTKHLELSRNEYDKYLTLSKELNLDLALPKYLKID